jgi:hypothetical protein
MDFSRYLLTFQKTIFSLLYTQRYRQKVPLKQVISTRLCGITSHSPTLKIVGEGCCEILVNIYQTIWCHIPDESNVHSHCCFSFVYYFTTVNLKCHMGRHIQHKINTRLCYLLPRNVHYIHHGYLVFTFPLVFPLLFSS